MINLSGINTGLPISNPGYVAVDSNIEKDDSTSLEKPADKVTISAVSKMASDLEKFSMPKWISSYVAPLNDLTSSVAEIEAGRKYQALFDGINGNGTEAQRYLDNDPVIKQGRQNFQQREALKTELRQYGEYWDNAFQTAMKAIGATNGKSYNDIVANDPSAVDQAHRIFKETLFSMPGISSLMSRLNVPAFKNS